MREHLEAFARGINDYYAAHPGDVPEWWRGRQVDPYMVVAFGRLFVYNWSIDEAYGDLRRGGIEPGFKPAQRGSNQFAIAPQRSAEKAAILAIDPHLSWDGPSRFLGVPHPRRRAARGAAPASPARRTSATATTGRWPGR